MKQKLFLFAISILGFSFVHAGTIGPDPLSKGKKEDINGIVIHAESKKPLKDVNVTAVHISKKEMVVKTDDIGNFSFDELESGTYKFIFEKTGYKKITKEKVVIKANDAFQLNIEMIEKSAFEIMPSPFMMGGIK